MASEGAAVASGSVAGAFCGLRSSSCSVWERCGSVMWSQKPQFCRPGRQLCRPRRQIGKPWRRFDGLDGSFVCPADSFVGLDDVLMAWTARTVACKARNAACSSWTGQKCRLQQLDRPRNGAGKPGNVACSSWTGLKCANAGKARRQWQGPRIVNSIENLIIDRPTKGGPNII